MREGGGDEGCATGLVTHAGVGGGGGGGGGGGEEEGGAGGTVLVLVGGGGHDRGVVGVLASNLDF